MTRESGADGYPKQVRLPGGEEIDMRCSVAGSVACNVRDLVVLRQALDTGLPAVEARCDAALAPPNAP